MEALLASYGPNQLKTSVVRPTLQLLKLAGVDTKMLEAPAAHDSPLVFLTTTLPVWLIRQPPKQQLLFAVFARHVMHSPALSVIGFIEGGSPSTREPPVRHPRATQQEAKRWRTLFMYLALLVAVVLSGLQSIHQINVNKHTRAYETALAQLRQSAQGAVPSLPSLPSLPDFENEANALVAKHAERASRALLSQRKLEVALMAKHRKDVERFVQTRYEVIKDMPINGYFRMQAHNAYETVPWLASNQNLGFLWLVVASDRIDLDIKLNAKGDVVLYHAPNNKALAYVLSRMDPNHTHLEDVLEWVSMALSHFPQHFLGINIENHGVPADLIERAFEKAGMMHRVYSPRTSNSSEKLPTVGRLVEDNKNLVVFVDRVPQSARTTARAAPRRSGDQTSGVIQGRPWLLFTKDYFNENDYACKDVQACNVAERVVAKRQDLGSREHIPASREWKEANAFANNAVGMPMNEKDQHGFNLAVHYDLARRGAFNPWGVKNSTVVGMGINRDFLRINKDVVGNLYENIALIRSAEQREKLAQRVRALEPFLTEVQNTLVPAVAQTTGSRSAPAFLFEIAETVLMNSPLTRFVIAHTAESFMHQQRVGVSHQSTTFSVTAAYQFFENEYKTTMDGYLPLLPIGLFCELCVLVARAAKARKGRKLRSADALNG